MNPNPFRLGLWGIVILLTGLLLVPITAQGQLATPQPSSPNLYTITTLKPTLYWQASNGATQYQFELYQITHDKPIQRIETDTEDTKYLIPTGKLRHFNRYKWRVRAVNTNTSEKSLWSQDQVFKVLPEFCCDEENDSDCDGIPDSIEREYFRTDPSKRTLFVRPKKRIFKKDPEPWVGFLRLFPGSTKGIANIPAFVEANIEVVVVGAPENESEYLQDFEYKPEDHPDWPCDIMEIVLEEDNAICEFEQGGGGHTYLMPAGRPDSYVWTWSTKGYTGGERHYGYGVPIAYPFPLKNYFEEGAYPVIEAGKDPIRDNSDQAVTDCSNQPQLCIHSSPMNLRLTASPTFNPPYDGLPDDTVEFNAISFDCYGKILKFTGLGKQYTKNEVLARTVVHEMGHALLSSSNEEHCPNPCCIMHRNTLDWEQRLFGPQCPGGKTGMITCEHSPGGCKDIRSLGVIHNHRHSKP